MIWVWSPADTIGIKSFPGKQYADWLGVNMDKTTTSDSNFHYSFDYLYRPFHRQPLFIAGFPVMVLQSATGGDKNTQWLASAWNSINTDFNEMRSLIAAAGTDKTPSAAVVNNVFLKAPLFFMPIITGADKTVVQGNAFTQFKLPALMKSVVYDKGYYWFRNRHTMSKKTIETDIAAMKDIGINTVERTMPGLYDDKFCGVLEDNQMNLIPRFWLLATQEIIGDDKQLADQKNKILKFVKNNRGRKNIIAWNLGRDVLCRISNEVFKPDYFYYEQKYVSWLADVCREVRQLDSLRPLVMDLHWDEKGKTRFTYYQQHLPLINRYMLEADEKFRDGLSIPLEEGMAWGETAVDLWPLIPSAKQSAVIPAWQDLENTNFVSMNGLLDMDGRKKQWYRSVKSAWTNVKLPASPVPDIRILKPAKTTWEERTLTYHVLYRKTSSLWRVFEEKEKAIRFEWYLVRVDQYGNTMFIKKPERGLPCN